MRILIADDSPLVRAVLRDLLGTETDCDVCGEAWSGRELLDKVRELRPDLVLLDFRMPVVNGFEATRLIRQEFPEIKILIVSANNADQLLPSALQSGADACIDKSDLSRQLLPAIRKLHPDPTNN